MAFEQIIKYIIVFNIGYFTAVIAMLFIYKDSKTQNKGYQPSTLSAEQLKNIKPPKS